MNSHDVIGIRGPAAEFATVKRKSAGLAWLLSMVLPGLGHVYCGLKLRGGLVMGFSLAGMWALVASFAAQLSGRASADPSVWGAALLVLPVLYVFGFIDAYFTAREINRGIDASLVDNPRVAAVLNLLTRGFGYFYLGERVKGLVVFFVLGFAQMFLPALFGAGSTAANAVSLVAILLSIAMAIDAYRIGRRSFEAQTEGMDLAATGPPSRLPAAIPLVAGGVIIGLLAVLLLAGMVVAALGIGQA